MSKNVREFTNKLIESAEEGLLDWKIIALSCLGYLSDGEVKEMAELNELLEFENDVESFD